MSKLKYYKSLEFIKIFQFNFIYKYLYLIFFISLINCECDKKTPILI